MHEFDVISTYFKPLQTAEVDLVLGIGDDAACIEIPPNQRLLVSCDTLVADVHFLPTWDPYYIAYKAVVVNVSDIAAMAGDPRWLTLALTLPEINESWLQRYAAGLKAAIDRYNINLIGGDTTRGPLSMTITAHGLVPKGQAVLRQGACPGDKIFVSGSLGAAALGVCYQAEEALSLIGSDVDLILNALQAPIARTDFVPYLREFASAAIDISDGLSSDLQHICAASHVGATVYVEALPVHSIVAKTVINPLDFALHGGDDYELCFTIPAAKEPQFIHAIKVAGLNCYAIGEITQELGLRSVNHGQMQPLKSAGFQHFK